MKRPSPSVHALLRKYGIRPRKRLGQHFLAAGPTIDKIVGALQLVPGGVVVEIGSGLGVMTRRIAERAGRVIAVERDERMVDILRAELGDLKNLTLVHGDILDAKLSELAAGGGRVKIAGNLPYNISTPILFWILENRDRISRAVIMVQREVAERIAARPGGKEYGTLSVMTQAQTAVRKLFDVSAASFVPPPEVQSSVIEIDFPEKDAMSPEDVERLRAVVRAAFGKRRKTLRNALLGAAELGVSPGGIDAALSGAGIDPGLRPEALSVEEFIRLARFL